LGEGLVNSSPSLLRRREDFKTRQNSNTDFSKTTKEVAMNMVTLWDQSRGLTSLQDQVIRLFEDNFTRDRSGHAELATWAPAVDIYETENELVIKADLPDLEDKDFDVRVENYMLTIRGERKFEKDINEDDYLRVERVYGPFTRSFTLPTTVNPESIGAKYRNGVLTLHMAKREESKPKQIKISVSANGE
jgi:HSP20 family protein